MTKRPRPQPKTRSRPPKKLAALQVRAFRKKMYGHYAKHARFFSWRATSDPYKILVSEIMLQQTQADRVVKKYAAFIARFPTIRSLARSRLGSVLKEWQGLGYNRRAKLLREAAQKIIAEHTGRAPRGIDALKKLPGIGPYTAAAILVFAFNQPIAMIETNIRSVYLHHFFAGKKGIDDKQIMPLIEQTLDARNPRKWYAALMDYGAYLKKTIPNPNRRSRHHAKQSPFAGSDRQIRGALIRLLIKKPKQTQAQLVQALDAEPERAAAILNRMQNEGLIKKQDSRFVAG